MIYKFLLIIISIGFAGCVGGERLSPMPMTDERAKVLTGGDPNLTVWCVGEGRAQQCIVMSKTEANRRARVLIRGY